MKYQYFKIILQSVYIGRGVYVSPQAFEFHSTDVAVYRDYEINAFLFLTICSSYFRLRMSLVVRRNYSNNSFFRTITTDWNRNRVLFMNQNVKWSWPMNQKALNFVLIVSLSSTNTRWSW